MGQEAYPGGKTAVAKGSIGPKLRIHGSIPPPLLYVSWRVKGKGKVHPRTGHEGSEGEYRYSSTLSLTSTLDGGGWSTPRPGRFTPGNDPVPIVCFMACTGIISHFANGISVVEKTPLHGRRKIAY
jgi:hypothetical protein